VDHLLLQERILVHLGDVPSGVDLEVAGLGQGHDEAPAEAAASEHRHDAEVEQQGPPSIHLLRAADAGVSQLGAAALLRSHHGRSSLGQEQWLLLVVDRLAIELLNGVPKVANAVLHLAGHSLSQVGDLLLHLVLNLVELVPELLLHLGHIAPGVHPVRLNVRDLLLVKFLSLLVSLYRGFGICLLWPLDDDRGYLLGSPDLADSHVFLEPLLNDLGDGHVVNLLRGLKFSSGNDFRSLICLFLLILLCLGKLQARSLDLMKLLSLHRLKIN
jgi:hypothetical protein